MPPLVRCPNCSQNEWLESSELNYLPRVSKMTDGKYGADTNNGIHVKI